MKRLSSKSTFFIKRIFPPLWFGCIIFFALMALSAESKGIHVDDILIVLLAAIFMVLIGYFIMRHLVFDLIDEAYDEGASLLFKNNGQSVRVDLTAIKNVSYTVLINPPRVTLSLRHETQFGDELTFSPSGSFIPFKKNKEMLELIDRIDRARGGSDNTLPIQEGQICKENSTNC